MGKFIQFLDESVNDRGIFKAIFFAGAPGSGKSFVASAVSSGSISPRIVNTDKPYEFLVKTYGGVFTGTDDAFVDRAKQLTQTQLVQYLNGMLPLFIDGTSNSPSALLQRVGILESLGYDVGMVFVNTDLDIALTRALSRERYVPPELIERVHASVARNKTYYKQKFGSHFYEVDNSAPIMDDSVIQRMYKQVTSFFTRPVENPIGQTTMANLKQSGEKYLAPNIVPIDGIAKKVGVWYAS